jgi:predicted nuclease of restriction endonuclease-like (RecB) superfamily
MSDILEQSFGEVVALIRRARHNAYQTVNTILVDLYWQVGQYISQKVDSAAWGEGVIDRLAQYISEHHLDLRGFNRRNLFRMKQLYESYCYDKKVAPLVRQLPWAHNLIILSKCKLHEEREF